MTLHNTQAAQGAVFAPDGIPLRFGDQLVEYQAALAGVIILDRSHEVRLKLTGSTALDLMNRISTNDLSQMSVGEGRPTIFTNPNARILDRVDVYQREHDVLVLGEPGRGVALGSYLQRNIFFGDDVQLHTLADGSNQLDLHGPLANDLIAALAPQAAGLNGLHGCEIQIGSHTIYIVRRKAVHEQRWTLLVSAEAAGDLWTACINAGAVAAGSLIYNVLRIRAGLPSVGRELSEQFIPLEVGLWDEISFSKGCYTGQEIIARMESRKQLAKTLVKLQLSELVTPPAQLYAGERTIGQLTSSIAAPDGEIFALGVVKPDYAQAGQTLFVGDHKIEAQVNALAGVQPERG